MRYVDIKVDEEYAVTVRGNQIRRSLVVEKDGETKRICVQSRYRDTENGGGFVNMDPPRWVPLNRVIRTWAEQEEMERRLADRLAHRQDASLRIAAALGITPDRVRIGQRRTVTVPLDALETLLASVDVDWRRQEAM